MKPSEPNHDPLFLAQSDPDCARRRRRIAWAWLVVACWAGIVWRLGADDFSAAQTSSFLHEWLSALFMKLDGSTRYQIVLWVRKSAHFVEYAILALLAFRAALLSAGRNRLATAAWVALFLVAGLASADEARQALSSTRTGSPFDVLLDLLGGAVAVIGLLLVVRRAQSDKRPVESIELT